MNIAKRFRASTGFTIVELAIVIVIIGILATIVIVGYGAVQRNAVIAAIQSDLRNASDQLKVATTNDDGRYPATMQDADDGKGLKASPGVTFQYTYDPANNSYCLSATSDTPGVPGFHVSSTNNDKIEEGVCDGHDPPGTPQAANFAQASAGCGVISGKAYCWGSNTYGELGNGNTTSSSLPVAVSTSGVLNGKTISKVVGEGRVRCAVDTAGLAYCWGYGGNGGLGNGSSGSSSVPVAVTASGVLSGKTITDISVFGDGACVVASGQAFCWGLGAYGRLGNGGSNASNAPNSSVPVAVSTAGVLSGKTITAISTGGNTSCAIATGQAYCWGFNTYGSLGNGNTTSSSTPVTVYAGGVLSGKTVTDIAAANTTCAVASGQAYCWGLGNLGQRGDGSSGTVSSVPGAVFAAGVLSGKTVTDIAVGYQQVCAVADGQAYCWGSNTDGQLGNNSTTNASTPVAVDTTGTLSGKTITSVTLQKDAFSNVSCAIAANRMYCWGMNGQGQLGNNSTTNSLVPVRVVAPAS